MSRLMWYQKYRPVLKNVQFFLEEGGKYELSDALEKVIGEIDYEKDAYEDSCYS